MLRHLRTKILAKGPLTVSEYMKECLTNPVFGYYMNSDVFGASGDFTTAPEVSQIFGEILGVWVVHEWMNHGAPDNFQVVELGPGRGTLAQDMLRVFSQMKDMKDKISMHLVEVSPKLSALQAKRLCGVLTEKQPTLSDQIGVPYRKHTSVNGPEVSWYSSLKCVPPGPSCYITNEFFDALPVHKFQKTDLGWCEMMVDVGGDEDKLRFVLSKGPTPASTVYIKPELVNNREHIEVSPEGGVIITELSQRLKSDGGFALVGDYGHNGTKTDTLRGFKKHKLHDVLEEPGTADLTADVDFSYFRHLVQDTVQTHGPIDQSYFLQNMGIALRIQKLLKKSNEEQKKNLLSAFNMLANPAHMGERFKFFAMTPQPKSYIPAGFNLPV